MDFEVVKCTKCGGVYVNPVDEDGDTRVKICCPLTPEDFKKGHPDMDIPSDVSLAILSWEYQEVIGKTTIPDSEIIDRCVKRDVND